MVGDGREMVLSSASCCNRDVREERDGENAPEYCRATLGKASHHAFSHGLENAKVS